MVVVLFVALRSRIYDVIYRHRANLLRLHLPFAQKESVKSREWRLRFFFSARENIRIDRGRAYFCAKARKKYSSAAAGLIRTRIAG